MKSIKYLLLGLCLCSVEAFSLDQKPWMGEWLEFYLKPSFTYRYYPSVNRGVNPSDYSSHDRFTDLELQGAFLASWDAQLGVEFADTSRQALGTQSAVIELRHQWLNDITGDALAFSSGIMTRWVSERSLKDVSCPYSAPWNFELGNSVGKEFSTQGHWHFRFWGYLGVGLGTRGRPWITPLLSVEGHFRDKHTLELQALGYFGFGKTRLVNVNNFHGYGTIFHQSIDLGLKYTYKISNMWGSLYGMYAYRVLAKAFPAHASTLEVGYSFPFSFFS